GGIDQEASWSRAGDREPAGPQVAGCGLDLLGGWTEAIPELLRGEVVAVVSRSWVRDPTDDVLQAHRVPEVQGQLHLDLLPGIRVGQPIAVVESGGGGAQRRQRLR